MTGLLIATLLTQHPTLATSDELRSRFAELARQREALTARSEALPWLKGSGAIASGLAGAGLFYAMVIFAEPKQRHAVPSEAVLGVIAVNLLAVVVLHTVSWAMERSVGEDEARLERDATQLRALASRP